MIMPTIWTDIQRISHQVRLSLKFERTSVERKLQPIGDPPYTQILRRIGYGPDAQHQILIESGYRSPRAAPALPAIPCLRINGLPDKNRLAPVARHAFFIPRS